MKVKAPAKGLVDAQGNPLGPSDAEALTKMQTMADGLVLNLARMPSFADELKRMEQWREDNPEEKLTPGQKLSFDCVQLVAKAQMRARRLVEKEVERRKAQAKRLVELEEERVTNGQ